jgi:hypothetical protein
MPHPDADALAAAPTDVVDPANPAPADARTFAELQSALDAAKERCRALRKQLRPIRRRLDKRMTSLDLAELQCPPYVLRVEQPSGDEAGDGAEAEDDDGGDEGERGAVFTKRRVSDFLTAAQYAAYCSNNPRPKRRRRIVCERRDDVPTAATVAAGSDMSTGSDGSDGSDGSASE